MSFKNINKNKNKVESFAFIVSCTVSSGFHHGILCERKTVKICWGKNQNKKPHQL